MSTLDAADDERREVAGGKLPFAEPHGGGRAPVCFSPRSTALTLESVAPGEDEDEDEDEEEDDPSVAAQGCESFIRGRSARESACPTDGVVETRCVSRPVPLVSRSCDR